MVFVRATKTAIKRLLTSLFFVFAIILATTVIVSNAVLARTGMDIPVEVNWSDQNPSSRPSSVTLRLMNGTTEVSNITLTSSNVDPSDSNKWVGVFASVPESSNYTIVEDSVSGYDIAANNIAPNINHNIAVQNTQNVTSTSTNNLGTPDFVLIVGNSNSNYYLWTKDTYSGTDYNQLIASLRNLAGTSFNLSSSNYKTTLPATFSLYDGWLFNESVTLSQSNGDISFSHEGTTLLGNFFRSYYYGEIVPATSSAVSFTNVKNTSTHNLTVHHLNEDNTPFAADTVTQYDDGDTYTATPIANNRYTPELTIGQATGIITQDTEVTYVYHPKFHTVTYQFTGSDLPPNASSLLPAAAEYDDGSTVTVATEPTANGYRFLGWTMNGQSISGTLTMPSNDVTISGSWERFNGYFAPSISKQITNSQNVYRYGDTVEFLITVSNTESYPITNVEVTENLVGARFLNSSGYTVSNTGDAATIATIPANGTVVLYAEYELPDDVTGTRTNSVEITAASAGNYYYLDPSQNYIASAQFDTQSWQDVPVLTGVNTFQRTILFYSFLLSAGMAGLGIGSVVKYKQKIKEREK